MEQHTPSWGLVGASNIAKEMAEALRSEGRGFAAITNRTKAKAEAFAKEFGIPVVYDTPADLFGDPSIDIVYIAATNQTHASFIEQALLSGKHVLCEKPITLNLGELSRCLSIARKKNLVLAEAMTLYHMPVIREIRRRIEEGDAGKVQVISVNFGSCKPYDMDNRFFNPALGGGALLDIGVYALSAARFFLSSSPDKVMAMLKKCEAGSDEEDAILLSNPSGQMATVLLSLHSKQPKRLMISCEKGYFEVMEYPRAVEAVFVDAKSGERETIQAGDAAKALAYEAIDMEAAVITGDARDMFLPCTWDVTRIQTGIRKQYGLSYPGERL